MLKQRFTILLDLDFEYPEGQKEQMMESLSKKLEKTRSELDLIFAELQTYWTNINPLWKQLISKRLVMDERKPMRKCKI